MNEFPSETDTPTNSRISEPRIRGSYSELLAPTRLLADTKTAIRSLLKAPAFSLSVIAILSVVIGANVSIFTALFDTSLKPLPYPDADRITYVFNASDNGKKGASRGQYLAFKKEADLFESFALINLSRMTVNQERLSGSQVTGDFFQLLGLSPVMGRLLNQEDCEPGADPVVVLPESVWRSEYNSSPDALGQTIEMNKTSYRVVGVVPDTVSRIAVGSRFFVPMVMEPWATDPRSRHAYVRLSLLARLKPEATPQAGLAQLTTIEQGFLENSAPAELRNRIQEAGWRLELGQPEFALTNSLLVLQVGCAVLLLLACLNLAGLLVSRASQRSSELSVRYSLGAGRLTLLRSMIVESALLVGAAAVIAIPITFSGIQLYNTFMASMPGEITPIEPQASLFAGEAIALVGLAIVLGGVPFAIIWKSGMIDPRPNQSRTASSSKVVRTIRSGLVVVQLAFSLVILVGAGLLTQSYLKTLDVDLGFNPSRIITSRVAFSDDYAREQTISARAQIIENARQIPGVDQVSYLTEFALDERGRNAAVTIMDSTLSGEPTTAQINVKIVSRDFFSSLGIQFLEGKEFDIGSGAQTPPQFVVDRAFVEKYLQDGKAIGTRIKYGVAPEAPSFPIVGVTERANLQGQRYRDGAPFVYYPIDGIPSPGFSIVVRTTRPIDQIAKELREAISRVDSGLPLYSVTTMENDLDNLYSIPRMITQLVAAFAAISLLISSIGLFSVVTYDISQRKRELGIRKSLGATQGQLVGMIMRQAATKIALAVAIGLMGSYFATRLLKGYLFDTSALDPATYIGVSILLVTIALLASYLPTRRVATSESINSLQQAS